MSYMYCQKGFNSHYEHLSRKKAPKHKQIIEKNNTINIYFENN